jgi:hypothetical protein
MILQRRRNALLRTRMLDPTRGPPFAHHSFYCCSALDVVFAEFRRRAFVMWALSPSVCVVVKVCFWTLRTVHTASCVL